MQNGFENTKGGRKSLREMYLDKRLFEPDTNLISTRAYNTIIGGAIAAGFGINFLMAFYMKGIILQIPIIAVFIAYFIMSLGGTYVVHRSSSAFVSAVGFLVLVVGMGLLLTFFFDMYLESSVFMAFGITAIITLVMTFASMMFPQLFLSMGRGLGITLIVTIIAEVICSFFFRGALGVFDYVVILLFCGYIGFDWARAQRYPKTLDNAIDSAADIYVDVVNLFLRILEIAARSKSND